jgi:glycosyltransferase involved in cell wall biosynthesis
MENKRKTILIACDSYRSLLGFRGKLMEALLIKNEVAVFTPTIQQDYIRDKLQVMGVSIYENDLDGSNVSILSDLAYISKLYKVMKLIKPDVFFPYTFKPVIYGSLVANFCKINHIVPMLTGLGYNFLNHNKKKTLVRKITRTLLKLSLAANKRTKLILQNNDDYKTLIKAGIINHKNEAFVVNGSGVDLSYYEYTKPSQKKLSFLMVARLINAKGIKEYYDAAKLIKDRYPNVIFKLIGPRDHNIDGINQQLFDKINEGNVIEYIGEVNDVRAYIKASSVVVLPSYYGEGVPRCLLEAMAMGRAVITCDSVGCKETINLSKDHQSGFLIPIKNASVLAEKMLHFILYPTDIIAFGKNGRTYAEEKFDVHKVNRHMLHILEANPIVV